MRYKRLTQLTGVILALFLLALVAGPASGATYDLCTGVVTKTIGTEVITLWGFGLDPGSGPCPATVPGPVLEVGGPGDLTPNTLTIDLRNTLGEPVSLHILGQMFSAAPTPTFPDGRVMSFTHEAAQSGGTAIYVWGTATNPFRAGTYMLQSGTNPAKQVQMGLYAAVKKDEGPNSAYPGVPYDKEQIVVFSEIDPEIHAAIAAGTYGPGGTITSSAFRHPRYFLINGEVFEAGGALDPINSADPWAEGQRVLLRFVNAGLETHVPQILGTYMTTVAEDGNPYNFGKEEYGFELAAAKTKDAVIQPAQGTYPLYDARLNMTNMGDWPGGMLAYLAVGAPAAPVAADDGYSVVQDTLLTVVVPGVLGNDTDAGGTPLTVPPSSATLVSGPSNGTLEPCPDLSGTLLCADGSFSYTPNLGFTGNDTFTYTANDTTSDSNVATVTIGVNPPAANQKPVAVNDTATTDAGVAVAIDVLANDTDADNDPLTIALGSVTDGADGSVAIVAGPQLQYTPDAGFIGTDSFNYRAYDGTDPSNVALVTVTVNPVGNQPPVAVDDNATVVRNSTGNLINVVTNDFDPDGTIDTTSVSIIDPPTNGTIDAVGAGGVVTYTPNAKFKGGDSFSYRVSDDNDPPAESLRETPTGLADEATVVFINVVVKLPRP